MTSARVKWLEGVCFVGQSGSGHSVVMDGAPAAGGGNLGFRPMEMLLIGLGGCTSFDVVEILRKGRQSLTGCEVRVEAERAETVPKVFTKIHLHFVVTGQDLDPAKVKRAIELSAEKYCSASAMLDKVAEITFDFEIGETPVGA
jgi:putative redox protein